MGEIAILKEKIAARKMKSMDIATQIDRRIRDIRTALPPLTKIEDLGLPLVAQLAAEAAALQEEYLTLLDEIEKGKKDLQG